MGKFLADKKSIAIIVISSLLFVVSILTIVLSILLIEKNKDVYHNATINEVIIEHDEINGNGVITGYTGKKTKIVLPNSYNLVDGKFVEGKEFKIIAIGENAFSKSNVECVELGVNIKTIKKSAFYACESLTAIKMRDVVKIEEYAFNDCSKLSKVEAYSSSKIVVERYAFNNCTSLADFDFLDYVSEIGEYAFNATYAQRIELPQCVKKIGDNAFNNCKNLKVVYLPDSLDCEIGDSLFVGCRLDKLIARGNVKFSNVINASNKDIIFNTIEIYNTEETIKAGCITDFLSIERLILPNSVSQVQNGSFANVRLIKDFITPAVYDISYDFEGVDKINRLVIIPSNISSEVGLYYAALCEIEIDRLIISEGITKLNEYSFSGINSLKLVSLPSTITEIDSTAFAGCEIEKVKVASGEIDCLASLDNENIKSYFVKKDLLDWYKEKYASFASKIFKIEVE